MPGIIDGRAWLANRRAFLQGEMAKEPPPEGEQRAAIEAELAAVDQELAAGRRHWWHRVLWGIGGVSRPG